MENIENNNIIGLAMPADQAMSILTNAYESNRMFEFNITYGKDHNGEDKIMEGNFGKYFMSLTHLIAAERITEITINSITPIIPNYKKGDKVMVLEDGAIGTVGPVWGTKSVEVGFEGKWYTYHRSELCKLPAKQETV